MRLRDPRTLGNVIVALLSLGVVAQVARVALRALDFRQATILYDLLTRPVLQPGEASDFGGGSLAPGLIGALLVVFVLLPIQATVLVLWLFWQGRLRQNARLLAAADSTAVTRRIFAVGAVAIATIVAEVLLIIVGGDGDVGGDPRTRVGLGLVLDLAVLLLMAVVAFTTSKWTREQHQFVQARG